MKIFFILLLIFLIYIHQVIGILCYQCHQTSKKCNNGNLDLSNQINCSDERCAVLKYETPKPGKNVLATIRDCATYTEHQRLQMVKLERPVRVVVFEECDTPLCNFSIRIHQFSTSIILTLILFMIK
ncbi:hypothetical protein ABEB36_008843 [Hypothenemus hampei]|uniref:Uncharacterized protein n=1 Tax=Hypothenemus hampei TaxID=57062 RepID=A0ABD1ENW8_HYPHA